LRHLGCTAIAYEPDGNVLPDFSVGQTTGVEVRRLNQLHIDDNSKIVGLELADMALWPRMTNFINNYSVPSRPTQTYGIFYTFTRPIPQWKTVQAELVLLYADSAPAHLGLYRRQSPVFPPVRNCRKRSKD
jgi:hypothetical protein